jgi:hypothetical protein
MWKVEAVKIQYLEKMKLDGAPVYAARATTSGVRLDEPGAALGNAHGPDHLCREWRLHSD